MIVFTLKNNGSFRDANDKLIGFFDRDERLLHVNNDPTVYKILPDVNEEHLCDIFNELFKKANQ